MNIKDRLIEWLGGVTKRDAIDSYNSAQIGKYMTLVTLQAYMRDINGETAEVWCDMVWKYVCREIEKTHKTLND